MIIVLKNHADPHKVEGLIRSLKGQGLGIHRSDGTQSTIQITSGSGPILSGEQAYQADVVYWLSRIIYAESGHQPLDGKIAVGNVVLNRVASPRLPHSVHDHSFHLVLLSPPLGGCVFHPFACSRTEDLEPVPRRSFRLHTARPPD